MLELNKNFYTATTELDKNEYTMTKALITFILT